MLGLGLLLLVYGGGRLLDALWPATQNASYQEIDYYSRYRWSHDSSRSFEQERVNVREHNASLYAGQLLAFNLVTPDQAVSAAYRGEKRGAFWNGSWRRVTPPLPWPP